VHQLCLLLGYRGRYGSDREGDVRAIIDRISEKLRRIRGDSQLLAPAGVLPGDAAVRHADRLSRTLMIAAGVLACAALILFLVFRGNLSSAVSGLQGV
jgi:type VI secretion system protein ImpK